MINWLQHNTNGYASCLSAVFSTICYIVSNFMNGIQFLYKNILDIIYLVKQNMERPPREFPNRSHRIYGLETFGLT